jgi:hypothetical protein
MRVRITDFRQDFKDDNIGKEHEDRNSIYSRKKKKTKQ